MTVFKSAPIGALLLYRQLSIRIASRMLDKKIYPLLFSYEIWIIGAGVILSMVNQAFLLPVCITGALLVALRLLAKEFQTTPVDVPILLILAVSILSLLITALPDITFSQVYRLWTGILLFYAMVNWIKSDEQIRILNWGFILAGLGLVGFSFISVEWNQTKIPLISDAVYEKFLLVVSDTVNPNVLAGSLLVFAVYCFYALIWRNFREQPGLWSLTALVFVLCCVMLVLSQSRSAIIALGFSSILLVWMRWRWGWLLVLFAAMGLVVLTGSIGFQELLDLVFGGQQFRGFESREDIWARGIFILRDFSLTGIGPGLFWEVVSRIYPLGPERSTVIAHVHNLFLQVGIDLGLPGLVAFLSIYLAGLFASWKTYLQAKLSKGVISAGLGAGLFAVQIAIGIQGVFDSVIWGMVRTAPLLWAVWGTAIAVWLVFNKNDRTRMI